MPIESFNYSLYNSLYFNDQEIIDEYIPKMTTEEINSFMRRFTDHYLIENEQKEEVEDADTIVVFEEVNNFILSENNVDSKIILRVDEFFDDKKCKNKTTSILFLAAKKYLEENKYKLTSTIERDIRHHFIQLAQNENKLISKIENVKLPINFYTYHKNKQRIGIALDKNIIRPNGYGHNFKIEKNFVSVKIIKDKQTQIEIAPFIKNISYWLPKNAEIHGFNKRTGIIWFDGKKVNDNSWQFPDGSIYSLNKKIIAIISFPYLTDSFPKMYKRLNIENKLREIINK